MSVTSIFINRPVLATAFNLVLLIVGWVAFDKLDLRHMPTVPQHDVEISTNFPGSQSETVEQRITKPMEDALSSLDGVRKITSESTDGQSLIHVKFHPGVDYKTAYGQVRDRVFSITSSLPETARRPEMSERSENASPIMYISFDDTNRDTAALSDYVRRYIEDPLRLIEGVAEVGRMGDQLYQVSILLDPMRLMEQQVTVSEVIAALKREKAFASGGELERSTGKQTVVLAQGIKKPDEYADIPIRITAEHKIRIKDVAQIAVTKKDTYFKFSMDGKEKIALQIITKPQANPLTVVKRVRQFLDKTQKTLPTTMKATVVFDATLPFKAAMGDLRSTLVEAIILVAIIVTLSLASFRAACIPMLTVPLCLVGTFAIMWFFKFSVNPITLLALVLAVGLVVDDAIVVVENIHHHMEGGLSALAAARAGMHEITFSVVVMTITLAAVYVPLAFSADDASVVLREFAWTLAGSVIISGLVALTLAPALCGRFLKLPSPSKFWDKTNGFYLNSLSWVLKNPKRVLGIAAVVVTIGFWGFQKLPSEWMPVEDDDYLQGYIAYNNKVPVGVRNEWTQKVESILKTLPEHERILTWEVDKRWLGWSMILKPRHLRDKDTRTIIKELQPKLSAIVGPMVGVDAGSGSKLDSEDALKIIIRYQGDYGNLLSAARNIIKEAKQNPIFQRLQSDETLETPKLKIKVDRLLAAELGVQMEAIEDTLHTFLSGRKVGDFNFKGFDYDVELRASPEFRTEIDGIDQFFVKGNEAQWIPLGSLVSLQETLEPSTIKHNDRMRSATISVFMGPGTNLEQGMQALEPIIQKNLPETAQYRFGGKAEKFLEAKQAQWLTYGLALVFIYLVLCALFESFIQPFVVLLTVPLSVAGAVAGLYLIGGTNNVYTTLGLVTLIGLITKHGILIVDFTRRLIAQGMDIKEAVLEAATRRLRPVLMTTFAMIFGTFPLLISIGSYAIARHHLGWIIVGGMLSGTFFSLYVIPLVYLLLAQRRASKRVNISDETEIKDYFKTNLVESL